MKDVLKKSGKAILLGNEAIVRGALESGVQFVSTYPGTPASEIGNTFFHIAKTAGVYFEFSINEKTALEAGVGASFSNLKTLVAMKNFGLNVAADALMPFCYTGTGKKGPTVIVVADDPSCHSSAQSEQNSRPFAYMAHIPILEPSDPQECKDYIKLGFEISEKLSLPVMVRLTTRVAHQKMPVVLNRIGAQRPSRGFVKDQNRFITMPPRVLEQHRELLDKIEKIKEIAEKSPINKIHVGAKSKKIGIITSGVSYLYVREALLQLNLNLPILKLGFFHPLPEKKIKNFIKGLNKVLVVEELEPFLEKEVNILAKQANPKLEILGKDVLSEVGELDPDKVASAIAKLAGKKFKILESRTKRVKHLPRFCTGWPTCPYWKLFAAVKQVAPKNTVFGGDIGCYMMAALPPHNLYNYLSCMGSSLGIAHGVKKATIKTGKKQKVIAFIGDGTFFHAGIPAVMNIVYNKSNPLIIILDNRITAMTGHQPNPGMGKTGMSEDVPQIKIEEILKALRVKHIKVIDPETEYAQLTKTIKRFLTKDEVSVIISKRICGLLAQRALKKKNAK
ncbi:MAG: indolepyruvate ferredoxin oxidoreductase subunit alpha [Parcubacteria group bacterium]|nr:indolepyruvate ferredoxin oxidoreductase subunit alpha [Parcubacteria group bacterium]